MAEKTEQPTARYLREARKIGKVFWSRDLTSSVLIFFFLINLLLMGNTFKIKIISFLKYSFTAAFKNSFTWAFFSECMKRSFELIIFLSLSLISMLFLIAIICNFIQVGPLFTLEVIKPKLESLNPIEGIKRIFSIKSFSEFIKSTFKLIGCSFLFYLLIKRSLKFFILSVNNSAEAIGSLIYKISYEALMRISLLFIFISIGDYIFQRWQYYKDLRMTKQQIKEEYRREEGDPHIKSRRKNMHEGIILGGVIEEVRKADFIVVNPKEIAVAIKYDMDKMNAPIILAKGKSEIAKKIKEIARKYNVPILENKQLARALNKIDVGEEIPVELYEDVAQILNFVYHLKRKDDVNLF